MLAKLHVGEDRNDLVKNFNFNCIIPGRKFGIKSYFVYIFRREDGIFHCSKAGIKRGSERVTPPQQLIESDLDKTML